MEKIKYTFLVDDNDILLVGKKVGGGMLKQLGIFLENKKKLIYLMTMLFVFILLLVKCQYGFGDIDESFYLTTSYRLVQGDSLFGNEWHLSQMTAFIMYPIIKIYMKIVGQTDGMILNFRYIYLVIQLITSIVIYSYIKKYSEAGAMFSSILFMIYAPFGIMALSYNSLGIILFSLSLIWYLFENRKAFYFLSGIFYALAVLCCPFLAIYCLYVIGLCFFSKSKNNKNKTIYYFIGIFITVIVFFTFVFSRVTISNFLRSLPCILNDPEHKTSYFNKLLTYFTCILFHNKYQFILYVLFVLIILKTKFWASKNKTEGMMLVLMISFIQLALNVYIDRYINYFMGSLHMLAIYCFIFDKDERIRKLFYYIFIPGVIYSLCLHLSSNQRILAISSASTVSMIAATTIIFIALNNKEHRKNTLKVSLMIYLCMLICTVFAFRMFYNFWDGNILQEKKMNELSIEKGILSSLYKADEFAIYYDDLEYIPQNSKVLFLTEKTWLYLCNGYQNCSFSAWTSGINEASISRLNEYYEINPNKIPEYIYIREDKKYLIEKLNIIDTFKLEVSTNNHGYIYKNEVTQ